MGQDNAGGNFNFGGGRIVLFTCFDYDGEEDGDDNLIVATVIHLAAVVAAFFGSVDFTQVVLVEHVTDDVADIEDGIPDGPDAAVAVLAGVAALMGGGATAEAVGVAVVVLAFVGATGDDGAGEVQREGFVEAPEDVEGILVAVEESGFETDVVRKSTGGGFVAPLDGELRLGEGIICWEGCPGEGCKERPAVDAAVKGDFDAAARAPGNLQGFTRCRRLGA